MYKISNVCQVSNLSKNPQLGINNYLGLSLVLKSCSCIFILQRKGSFSLIVTDGVALKECWTKSAGAYPPPPPLLTSLKCYGVRWSSRSLLVLTLWTYIAFSWVSCVPSSPCHNKHHMFTRQYIGFLTHIPLKVVGS